MKRISQKSKVCRAAPNFGVGRTCAWKHASTVWEGTVRNGQQWTALAVYFTSKIEALIEALRYERYHWTPARRISIEKRHSKKKRPLGLPSWSNKLLQEVMRLILSAYYEP